MVFRFLVLISGLELATSIDTYFQVQLFTDWIYGLLGDRKENCKISKIVQVVIAGNIFEFYLKSKYITINILYFLIGNSIRSTPIKKPNYRDKIDDFPRDIQAIKQLDNLLLQLVVRIIYFLH